MRLVGTENLEAGTLEGRVEVCINKAWGTVCDNLFGQEDAETVCGSIGGFYRNGKCVHRPTFCFFILFANLSQVQCKSLQIHLAVVLYF